MPIKWATPEGAEACPFCASPKLSIGEVNGNSAEARCWVWCPKCAASGPAGTTRTEALLRWNTRTVAGKLKRKK